MNGPTSQEIVCKIAKQFISMCQTKNPREHNQKDANATTQTTNCIRDIPVFQ
jgi:hypothetical protein